MKNEHIVNVALVGDTHSCFMVEAMLSRRNSHYSVVKTGNITDATDVLSEAGCNIILLDLELNESQDQNTRNVRILKSHFPNVPLIAFSERATEHLAEQSIHYGAHDYIATARMNADSLHKTVQYALERDAMLKRNADNVPA